MGLPPYLPKGIIMRVRRTSMRLLSGLLVLLFCCSVALGEAIKGFVPAAFVLRSGDTMTGLLRIDTGGRNALVLDGTQTINIDWDQLIPGQGGLVFTQTGTQDGEWIIKLPPTGAPQSGIDSAFNWKLMETFPVSDGIYNLGGDLLRWKEVWSYDGHFKDDLVVLDQISGGSLQIGGVLDPYVNETGDTMTGSLIINPVSAGDLLDLRPDWSLGTVIGIDITNPGGTYDQNDFYLRINDVLGTPGEYDGLRSDGVWRGLFFQSGNGEPLIADNVGKTLLYPGGIYAELDLDSPFPVWAGTFIDASQYHVSGPVGAGNLFFNAGNAGGALSDNITLSFLGVLTINQVNPIEDGVGHVGSSSGNAFAQVVAKDIQAEESMKLPTDISTFAGSGGVTEIELAVQDVPLVTQETLRIGNVLNGGYVDITGRGTIHINTDGPQNEEALRIERDGSGLYSIFNQSGKLFCSQVDIEECPHLEGFTVFAAYEQTDQRDDVGYYRIPQGQTRIGSDVYIGRVWIDMQSENDASYISNVAIKQRHPTSMILETLWSQATTIGQGTSAYVSTFVDVSPPVVLDRMGLIEITCSNLPAYWVRLGRVASQIDTRKP